MHEVEGEMLCKLTNESIPYFNAGIFLENKTKVGKIEEILGPINQVRAWPSDTAHTADSSAEGSAGFARVVTGVFHGQAGLRRERQVLQGGG